MTNAERFTNRFYQENGENSAVLLTSNSSRFYVSGFSSSDGLVLVTKEQVYLVVDFRYYEMAKNRVVSPVEVVLAHSRFSDTLDVFLKKHRISSVFIEDSSMTVSELERYKKRFSNISFLNLGNFLDEIRAVKSKEEIHFISEAQKITDKAFLHILNFISEKKTEREIALELEFFMRKNGSEGVAFDTICVSGKNSSLPHGTPTDKKLSQNAFITMDFGAKFAGYCADMTRTVVLGKADEEMKSVYKIVLDAQRNALAKIKAGVLGSEIDSAARDIIASYGYAESFGHSTGHGLGIDVHEAPSFSPNYKKVIPEGAVLSVEPGIYIEGKWGVRIEDIVVVAKNGCINLTASEKELIEI